jgi:hypothetical protein
MGPDQRRLLNQAIFEKLYVLEYDGTTITEARFKDSIRRTTGHPR